MSNNSDSSRAWKTIRAALVIAGIQVGGALLLTLFHRQGMIDGDTTKRGVMILVGLGIAAYGNRLPKMLDGRPPGSLAIAELRQAIHRVGGWAMTLGGLGYAGAWAFAPREMAPFYSTAAACAGVAVMIAYGLWRARAHDRSLPDT